MAAGLNLPDRPELQIGLGPAPGIARRRAPWHLRVRDTLSVYLPLLLMTALALFTWWLVKNTPAPTAARPEAPARRDPDYTMNGFVLERFDAEGRFRMRIEGAVMRHFPDTDRLEIEDVRLRAVSPQGRVTVASARRALSNGNGSEVQLLGDARVDSVDAAGRPLAMRGAFLHAFFATERLRSHLPVQVAGAGGDITAGGLQYDHGLGRLELMPPIRAVLPPAGKQR